MKEKFEEIIDELNGIKNSADHSFACIVICISLFCTCEYVSEINNNIVKSNTIARITNVNLENLINKIDTLTQNKKSR